jgi:hypothetical protein
MYALRQAVRQKWGRGSQVKSRLLEGLKADCDNLHIRPNSEVHQFLTGGRKIPKDDV